MDEINDPSEADEEAAQSPNHTALIVRMWAVSCMLTQGGAPKHLAMISGAKSRTLALGEAVERMEEHYPGYQVGFSVLHFGLVFYESTIYNVVLTEDDEGDVLFNYWPAHLPPLENMRFLNFGALRCEISPELVT